MRRDSKVGTVILMLSNTHAEWGVGKEGTNRRQGKHVGIDVVEVSQHSEHLWAYEKSEWVRRAWYGLPGTLIMHLNNDEFIN
jgi:hypothetical protein